MRLIDGRRKLRLLMWVVVASSLAACGGGGGGGSASRNTPPIANAGADQTAFKGEAVQLDASASTDADGNPLTYAWVQTSGPTVALSSASGARVSFTAPRVAGTLVFSLTVNDGRSASSADSVSIEVLNRVPSAAAGPDRTAGFNTIVTLSGSDSFDPDNDALTYTWVQTHGVPVTLNQEPNGDATFLAPSYPSVLQFNLTVSDGALTSNVDTVLVSVAATQIAAPYVDAGWDQTAPRNSTVMLLGWVYDQTGTPVSISWRQISGPTVALLNANTETPSFQAPSTPAEFEFELTASNAYLTSVPDTVRVVIRNFAPYVSVELTPQAPTTLDDLTATAEVLDADGDAVTSTYVWRRNGSVLNGFTGTSLPDTQFVKGDEIELTWTASDGFDSSVVAVSVTVVDSPAVFVASPAESVDFGDTFAFTLSATDADENDPVDDFRLLYGPAGMSVSNAGEVSWPAILPMFGPSQRVNFAIGLVGNEASFAGAVRVDDAGRAPPLRRTGVEIPARDGALRIADLDNDGDREVLVASHQLVQELAWNGAAYEQRWAYPFHLDSTGGDTPSIAAGQVLGDARPEIFISSGERIIRLNAATRMPAAELELGPNEICRRLELADLDQQGDLDLICLAAASSYSGPASFVVIDPVAMTITRRTLEFGGQSGRPNDFAIGNVDADAALEMIAGAGYVFDGVTGASEWVYGPGFGHLLDAGDVDGDGVDEIVGVQNWTAARVFDAVARSPVWDFAVSDTAAVSVRDIQGDAAEEILIGDGQWGEVTAYRFDSATSQAVQLWTINSQGHGVTAIEAGNLDGDNAIEFIWGTDATSSGPDSIVVAGLNPTISVEWINDNPKQLGGPFIGGQLAPLAAGGSRLVFGAPRSDNGYGGAALLALNPATGLFTISNETGTNWSSALALDVVDYDQDGDAEVFLGSSELYSGYFAAYNFLTDSEEWRSPADVGVAQAITNADYSADGYADMVVMAAGGSAGNGTRIHVFDPRNSNLIWRSVALTGAAVDIAVAQLAGTSTPEIIAATHDRVAVYQRSGAVFLEIASYSLADISDLLVADTNSNGAQEIYVMSGWSQRIVTRLTPTLAYEASYPAPAGAVSLHLENLAAARRNIVVSSGDPHYYGSNNNPLLRAVDPMTGAEVWRSPELPATTPRNSLFYVDPDQDGRPQISFGAGASMFLTR